jgi:hypothetical protein
LATLQVPFISIGIINIIIFIKLTKGVFIIFYKFMAR